VHPRVLDPYLISQLTFMRFNAESDRSRQQRVTNKHRQIHSVVKTFGNTPISECSLNESLELGLYEKKELRRS
jgi:hypothetical protein